jgi:PASTA domain-containing protein
MRSKLTCSALVTALALVGTYLLPTAASADTVRIGSALGHAANPNGELCTNCVGVQRSQVGGNSPLALVSPANGLLTQWAVRTSDPGAIYNLRILRPATNTAYTGAGIGPAITVPPLTTDSVLINTISVPVKQGDAIGVSVNASHGLPSWPDNVATDVVGYVPAFADGTSSGNTTDIPGHELLIQATVSYCNVPNLHRLKKVLARTALTNADCGIKVKKKETHKTKFRGKVLKQKLPPGTTAAPGTVVAIVVGQK